MDTCRLAAQIAPLAWRCQGLNYSVTSVTHGNRVFIQLAEHADMCGGARLENHTDFAHSRSCCAAALELLDTYYS